MLFIVQWARLGEGTNITPPWQFFWIKLYSNKILRFNELYMFLVPSDRCLYLPLIIVEGFYRLFERVYSILFYPITLEGRWGTTDEFATIPFHLDLFSAALVELAKSIPVHSLILSSHLFFCLPLFLFPFTVP